MKTTLCDLLLIGACVVLALAACGPDGGGDVPADGDADGDIDVDTDADAAGDGDADADGDWDEAPELDGDLDGEADGDAHGDADDGGGDDDGIPTAEREVAVAGCEGIRAALDAAEPGDHIVVADGTYRCGSTLRITRGGEPGRPVVLRADSILGAIFEDQGFELAAPDVAVQGLDIVGRSTIVIASSDRGRITRCRLRDTPYDTSMAVRVLAGDDIRIDHCELGPFSNRALSVHPHDGDSAADLVRDIRIDHNYFHDTVGERENAHEALQIGGWDAHRFFEIGAVVEYNLFERVDIDDEVVSIKSSGNTIQYNTFISCRGHLSNRHGRGNTYIANLVEGSGRALIIMDEDNLVVGHRAESAGGGRVLAGTSDEHYPAASGNLFVGCHMDVVVGDSYGGVEHSIPAADNRFEGHVGRISLGHEVRTVEVDSPSMAVPATVRLAPEDVGPYAP